MTCRETDALFASSLLLVPRELALQFVRISFGCDTTREHVDKLLDVFEDMMHEKGDHRIDRRIKTYGR